MVVDDYDEGTVPTWAMLAALRPYKAAHALMTTARNGLEEELKTVRAYLKFHVGRPGKDKEFDALIASINVALEEHGGTHWRDIDAR